MNQVYRDGAEWLKDHQLLNLMVNLPALGGLMLGLYGVYEAFVLGGHGMNFIYAAGGLAFSSILATYITGTIINRKK